MALHTIKSKVNLSVGFVILTLVVVLVFSFYVISQMSEFKQDIGSYRDHQKEARITYNLQLNVSNIWQFFTDASLTKDLSVIEKEGKPAFEEAKKEVTTLLELNRREPEHVKKLSEIKDSLDTVWEIGNRMVAAYRSDWNEGNLVMDEYDKACDRLIKAVGAYAEVENKSSDKAVDEMCEMSNESTRIAIIISVVIFSICCALFLIMLLLRKSILPLPLLAEKVALIASGDLQVEIAASGKDEVARLSFSIKNMTEKLRSILSLISQTSIQVASAANQLNTNAEQIATGAEEVAAQSSTVATAGEEMSATSGDIAQNCQMAAEGAQRASQSAQNGASVVEKTVAVMGQIAVRVQESAKTVGSLGDRSDQIGNIIGTIEDIADQTNLLALNAAIEAARAGEQGRGFAVVADEVRALAERTTRATKEISEMIKAIQKETKGAVVAMEQGVHQVEVGTVEAAKSGDALRDILEQINAVAMQINQIATAAEEQTATTSEISSNMMQITEVVQQTSQGAQESATAAAQLKGNADELQRLVRQFKL